MIIKRNSYKNLKQKLKYSASAALAGAMTIYSTGCASLNYDVQPLANTKTDDSGRLEAMIGAGITITVKNKSVKGTSLDPQYHGGFFRETGQTLVGPFHIYRSADKKWMPEWKEHPIRTSLTTVLYIGAAAMAAGGSGGGNGGNNNGGVQIHQNYNGSGSTASGSTASGSTASGSTASGSTSSGSTASGSTASGSTASGSTASGSTASGSTASGSTASGSTASGSTSSGSTAGGISGGEGDGDPVNN